MRTIGAVLLVVGLLFVGILGMTVASDSVEDTVANSTNQTQDMFDYTQDFTGTTSTILSTAMLWGGLAAMVLTAVGVLVYVGPRGR